MPEPETIVAHVGRLLERDAARSRDGACVVTAGPDARGGRSRALPLESQQREDGRGDRGRRLAPRRRRDAHRRPAARAAPPAGVDVVPVETTEEMRDAVERALAGRRRAGDGRGAGRLPAGRRAATARSRRRRRRASIALEPTPDILRRRRAARGGRRRHRRLRARDERRARERRAASWRRRSST